MKVLIVIAEGGRNIDSKAFGNSLDLIRNGKSELEVLKVKLKVVN